MKLNVVTMPGSRSPLRRSPGFAKKLLSEYALDLLGLCEYGCRYCSSNAGNYLRINREPFADETQRQLGERRYPSTDPTLTFHWQNVLPTLRAFLKNKPASWGAGKTVVFSMLTDGFSPGLVADGTTLAALDLLLRRTSLRIRILTKNACVGLSPYWIDFFAAHTDRFVVGLSTGTLDDNWSRKVEINTPAPSQRIKALHRLQDAGVPTYGMLCPIFPDVLASDGLERLVAAIRPESCETIWAEPYNDRANWQHVRAGYESGVGYDLLTAAFANGITPAWSRYATDLLLGLRQIAERDGWLAKLIYLLYETHVTQADAERMGDLRGVLLQSTKDECGRSTNRSIAKLNGALTA